METTVPEISNCHVRSRWPRAARTERALVVTSAETSSSRRPYLLPRPDPDALEESGFAVGVAGGKGSRLGEVGEVEDDQAAVHRRPVVGEGRPGSEQLVAILVEIREVCRSVFLAYAEMAGLVGAEEDKEHARLLPRA